ncbi:EPIDERMAL PATTERNING FACTOR-like protein 2 [Jatropha curcas]|uniref:EPIDERMAL PATTERNING FACTOR-like protein 2 n=1 Tax=Jatropha curcas TaxID=180498 RepID=UPI0005FAB14C|nr:EPIDERMAL PATTERNING FACTOR-like protein 2 [Jatropha curcas]
MGSAQICYCSNRNRKLTISLLLFLLATFTLLRFSVEGRAITKLLEVASAQRVEDDEKVLMRTQVIGSTPPRCERRCNSCGHCEAVQVPVTPQFQSHRRNHLSTAISSIAYSRGDDASNYKPMSWKCKCGNLILNP